MVCLGVKLGLGYLASIVELLDISHVGAFSVRVMFPFGELSIVLYLSMYLLIVECINAVAFLSFSIHIFSYSYRTAFV